ncbi:dihydrofolate reductase family protein [Deinococcus yunweiensis]|uniref:dihydrofolate reductase family protein n=1 Tax=Deinococcus yunweiensis TaxID=367282 RepID=UPI00398E614C
MSIVLLSMFVSLDGFVNNPQGKVGPLYPDPAAFGDTAYMRESIQKTGAVVMGRRTFDMGDPADYVGQYEYQVPIFVVTHHPPEVATPQDEHLTFTFVTGGIEDAVTRARAAAGNREVLIIGASAGQQALNAGVVDELELGLSPMLFGGGTPLLAHLERPPRLEQIRVTDLAGVTILRYRVLR